MAAGWPIVFDRLLIRSEKPIEAEYIICLTGGVTKDFLPGEAGWQRIYTAVQLYLDNYAPKIIFSGGGAKEISEAEVYGEAAQWIGCPKEVIIYEPQAKDTSEHPGKILSISGLNISRESRLDIVTSNLHSRRTYLCFKKHGFTNFRIITHYSSMHPIDLSKVRTLKKTRFQEFQKNGRKSQDAINRFKERLDNFLTALREIVAIALYKMKGVA
jgi:uncharacterized SAM-binding protein YcdF (DUF218 family)